MISQGFASLSVVWVKRQMTALDVGIPPVSQPLSPLLGDRGLAPHMFLAGSSKDWGCSGRIVGVELDIKELGEV